LKDETGRSSPPRSPDSEAESRASPDTEQLAAQMSALLADLVRTPQADLDDWTPSLAVGHRLGRFTLVRELGRGGMGVVWEAEDPELSRRVAVKVVKPGANARVRGHEWLQREAEAVARLSHPNIVTLFDFGLAETGPYLVFELLRGQPLDKRLRGGPLPFDSVLAIGIEVSRALVHAHRAGVVHRDLKPANVYVSDAGEVKVLDFGLAALLGRTGPREGGTPAFMAPEQWRGELGDERTDLFALGVTLFSALTGGVPYPVKEGRSAVEQAGPTPRLPPAVAPARFRRLVERCLERDPSRRPGSSKAVLDELRDLKQALDGRARHRLMAGLVVAAVAAVATAGWLWWTQLPPPDERVTTVVADVENRSGDPNLDGLGPLLATALEQSRRLEVLSRTRLAGLAREARLPPIARLDARAARELARLGGAKVLLLPAVRRDGAGLVLELRAVDPADDRAHFTLSESAREPGEVPAVLDRLADSARRKLRERTADLAAGRIRLAEAFSPNLEALRAYQQGVDCLNRPDERTGAVLAVCPPVFERALALDPTFALAHYQLSLLAAPWGVDPAKGRPHAQAAVRSLARLPAREAALVRAWAAHLEGKDDEALQAYDELLARFPDDTEALDRAALLQWYRRNYGGAVPYWRRFLALDPSADATRLDLLEAYAMLDRRADLKALVDEARALPTTPVRQQVVVEGLLRLGEGEAAVAAARAAHQADPSRHAAGVLATALDMTGHFAGLEALRRGAPREDFGAVASLADAVASQGRFAEALRILDGAAGLDGRPASAPFIRAMWLGDGRDRQALWRESARAGATHPDYRPYLAVPLALRGDVAHAASLLEGVPRGPATDQVEALAAWHRGDAAGALARLTALDAAEPEPVEGLYPSYLLAEVASAAGDHRTALEAVERWRRQRVRGYWHAWAWPRSLLIAARAHASMGDKAAARRELDRLGETYRRADPGLPLTREARALATTL
jgi:eukaryotic-like serine/threonine-protein kinase